MSSIVFCPEQGESPAEGVMVGLATAGRKRGFCPIWATQRLALVDKSATSQLQNRMVGIDMAHARLVEAKRALMNICHHMDCAGGELPGTAMVPGEPDTCWQGDERQPPCLRIYQWRRIRFLERRLKRLIEERRRGAECPPANGAANILDDAMKCPVHIGTEMVPVETKAPRFVVVLPDNEIVADPVHKRAKRSRRRSRFPREKRQSRSSNRRGSSRTGRREPRPQQRPKYTAPTLGK